MSYSETRFVTDLSSVRATSHGRKALFRLVPLLLLTLTSTDFVCAEDIIVTLKSGMRFGPGQVGFRTSMNENAHVKASAGGEVQSQPILVIDDDLRATYVRNVTVQNTEVLREAAQQRIDVWQQVATNRSTQISAVGKALGITPFNEYGRRIYSLNSSLGRLNIVQGITEVSPTYLKVESLRSGDAHEWDLRLAMTSIPTPLLTTILKRSVNLDRPDDWLKMVRLYSQAKQYGEAKILLKEAIDKFPELDKLRTQLKQLDQQRATQMLDEVELRRNAGQHELAAAILRGFPVNELAIETQLKVNDLLTKLGQSKIQSANTIEQLREQIGKLPPGDDYSGLMSVVEEIAENLTPDNSSRLADFQRLKDDETLAIEQRVALGIGGWLLGSGAGEDNLAVVRSLVKVRDLVTQYLNCNSPADRADMLAKLRSEEGSTPLLVSKMIDQMAPPSALPEQDPDKVPGLFRITIPNPINKSQELAYWVQLPPEYNPYRKYPCVVTLNGEVSTPEQQLQWWVGDYLESQNIRVGHASRHGFVVVAPEWLPEGQFKYNYTEDEQERVVVALRDAMRKISIDSDRIFITGHFCGGSAAWDIALSHPDLWAGMVCVGGDANKFVKYYADNSEYVPMYFVFGELDGAQPPLVRYGAELDAYFRGRILDCTAVGYHGRGPDHFYEELPRIIEWMNLASHKRNPFPTSIEVSTMRAGDRSFWWLELGPLKPGFGVHPLLYDLEKNPRPGVVEAKLLYPNSNRISLIKIPSDRVAVWLAPGMLDFNQTMTVEKSSSMRSRVDWQPSLDVLLEDVRQRAERQHPFWAKVEL